MARSIDTIYNQLLAQKAANTDLSGLTSTSKVAYWNLWLYIQAVCANLLEQAIDAFITTEIEPTVSALPPATPQWVKDQVLKFQYDATTPQIITLVDFIPTYAIVDETLRIITQCAVITDANKNVRVKVAKDNPPVKLAVQELADLQSTLDLIEPAGVSPIAISLDPDRLFIEATIYYDGQYTPVISDNVIAAINAFLLNIPFNGVIRVSALEEAIIDVTGVNDIVFTNIRARDSVTALGSAQYLIQNQLQISRSWNTVAGYIEEENTAGNTFADKLTFVVG